MRKTALDLLAGHPSWQLNRMSTTTFPQDVVVTVRRSGQPLSEAEADTIMGWVRTGCCYRCRLGRGRFHFGRTPLEAARAAVAAEKAKKSKSG
jgi:hypothetical protein